VGRPSIYTPEIAAEICERLAGGESLLSICRDERFPTDTAVRIWALQDREGFFSEYTRARNMGLDVRAERVLELARGVDKEDVPRARLEFDAERWYLSKLAPKVYGDATLLKHGDAEGNVLKVQISQVTGTDE